MNRKGAHPKKPARHGDDQGGLPYNRSSPWKAAVGMAFDDGLYLPGLPKRAARLGRAWVRLPVPLQHAASPTNAPRFPETPSTQVLAMRSALLWASRTQSPCSMPVLVRDLSAPLPHVSAFLVTA